jgi:methylmalonyl-CoA mutase cobalamin-binding domain/chain
MVSLGEMWREGHLRAAQEHLATSIVRTILGDLLRGSEVALTAPAIVVVTPAGQLHEIGALLAAATAASEGWKVIYLGTNLPAEEIAGAAAQARARAVALSIVHPSDDPRLPAEIEKLRRYLSNGVAVLVGGRSAAQYVETLQAIGAVLIPDLPSFRMELEHLRTGHTLHRQE